MAQALTHPVQMREWYAQIAIPETNGVVEVLVGNYPAMQGETVWAWEQARRVAADGCRVQSVRFRG